MPRLSFSTLTRTPRGRRILQWALVVAVLLLIVVHRARVAATPQPQTVGYSELLRAMAAGEVDSIVVIPGQEIRGHWSFAGATRATTPDRHFSVAFPVMSAEHLEQRADSANVAFTFQPPPNRQQLADVVNVLINLAFVSVLVFYLWKQMRSSNTPVDARPEAGGITFADIAGNEGAIAELREIVAFLRTSERYTALGASTPKGAILFGPPGTGKTLMARAVAGEAGVPFYSIAAAEITGFIVGLGAHRIKRLFKQARKTGGVIFIDEIDAFGRRGRASSHNEDDRTLNQLLVEMDGFTPRDGVVVIAATNRPDDLDPALRRPGRFDRHIAVGLPTVDERAAILALHVRKRGIPLAEDVDLGRLARLMPGASGADLANLVNEAAIAAGRDGAPAVRWAHIEAARDRVVLGKERAGFQASATEWRTVAFHEAGHALVGVLRCPEDGLHKVTIQPRGDAMGVAHFAPDDDRHLYSRRYLEGVLCKALAGRAAEELIFGPEAVTSGAESDLRQANRIARRMVYQLGLGNTTGFLVHVGEPGALSPTAQAAMDDDVRQLLTERYEEAKELLAQHRAALTAVAEALLARETLDGAEVLAILRAHGVPLPTSNAPKAAA